METNNLTQYSAKELEVAAKAIQEAYEYNEPIDERFELEWKVIKSEALFMVAAFWFKGEGSNGNDPTTSKDSTRQTEEFHFHILERESFRKFTKEVMDAIAVVVDKKYDECLVA